MSTVHRDVSPPLDNSDAEDRLFTQMTLMWVVGVVLMFIGFPIIGFTLFIGGAVMFMVGAIRLAWRWHVAAFVAKALANMR